MICLCVINATSYSSSTLEVREDLEGDEIGLGPELPAQAELKGDSIKN